MDVWGAWRGLPGSLAQLPWTHSGGARAAFWFLVPPHAFWAATCNLALWGHGRQWLLGGGRE